MPRPNTFINIKKNLDFVICFVVTRGIVYISTPHMIQLTSYGQRPKVTFSRVLTNFASHAFLAAKAFPNKTGSIGQKQPRRHSVSSQDIYKAETHRYNYFGLFRFV